MMYSTVGWSTSEKLPINLVKDDLHGICCDFVACNLLMTSLQHEKIVWILNHLLKPYDNRGLKSVVIVL